MVGTFYSASSPDSEPFVKIGTKISADSTVCIIEAMKVMNEIKADISGENRRAPHRKRHRGAIRRTALPREDGLISSPFHRFRPATRGQGPCDTPCSRTIS